MNLIRTLFSFDGKISRVAYVAVALSGVLVKRVVDGLVAGAFHRHWDFMRYLIPLGVPVTAGRLTPAQMQFLVAMVAVSIPFAWVGIAITAKRFRTIGWPSWFVVLFFVPIANIFSFALAAVWPEHESAALPRRATWASQMVPKDALGSAIFALLVTGLLGAALVPIGTVALGSYGWGLFAAIPFSQGAIAAYVYAIHEPRTLEKSVLVALLSIAVTMIALLGLALEGAICIAMAAPLAAVFAFIGAIVGHAIARRTLRPNIAVLLVCVLLGPTIMGAERVESRVAPVYVVTTLIDIAAPPSVVWKNVIRFPDLPPPRALPFRLGIAYPIRAKIVGRGVGAVRYCEFSTGSFVEPITVWEPGHELAFSVRKNAEPMQEWSPYGHIDTPHLHNYMVSLHGQFVLQKLPNGGTRLIGTTWYQHHLWPAAYWRLWSDAIIHDIHSRVLKHIKALSEHTRMPAV